MTRPDALDRDVAVLLALDAAAFLAAPKSASRPTRKRGALRPPWLAYGAPLAVALMFGAGIGLMRLSNDQSRGPQQSETTPRAAAPVDARAMSLQVRKVARPRPARGEARQAVDFDPTATTDGAGPTALVFDESAGPAPADHAADPQTLEISAFSMLLDQEIGAHAAPEAGESNAREPPPTESETPPPPS